LYAVYRKGAMGHIIADGSYISDVRVNVRHLAF